MKTYSKFLKLYTKVSKEILAQKKPIDAIHIVENNFPSLLEISKEVAEEFSYFSQNSEIEDRTTKHHLITVELNRVIKKMDSLISDYKHSSYHFDEGMEKILRLFISFRYSLPKNINTNELYVSKNNDFLLAIQEIKLREEEETLPTPDFDSYKTIVFINDKVISEFYEENKKHFSTRNHYLLKQAINGIDIGNGKLIFHGDAKEFVVLFKSLYDKKLLVSRQKMTIKWIMDNFKFYKGDVPSDFKIETIKKYLRKETY